MMLAKFKIMKRKTALLWMVLIICLTCTTLSIITKNIMINSNASPTNFMKYFQFHQREIQDVPENHVKFMIQESLEELKKILEERARYVVQMCKQVENRTQVSKSFLSNIVLDKQHGVSWCPVYKAASSTWMKNFADLSGVLTDTTMKMVNDNLIQLNNIVRQIFSNVKNYNDTLKAISETKKFIIVRHPFQRLLSAYRDKLEHIEKREYYYKHYGRHIVLKYRKNETIRNRTSLVPSFREFLEFIVHEEHFDEHWIPYHKYCEPCLINYDYVLKFEHLAEEQWCLLKVASLFQYLDPSNDQYRNTNAFGATTDIIAKQYYKTIPIDLLKKVYKLYEKDFLLFSYVPEEYYLMTRDLKDPT